MFDLFMAIENSSLGITIRESAWGFAIALALHAIGMATSVGVVLLINFRILGLLKQIPVLAPTALFGTAWLGFVINFLSGVALYSSHASKYSYEWIFILKLSLLALGGLFMKFTMDAFRSNPAEFKVKAFSVICICCWLGAVVTGRLMAYFYSA